MVHPPSWTIKGATIGVVVGVAFIIAIAFISFTGSPTHLSSSNNTTTTSPLQTYQIIRSDVIPPREAALRPCAVLGFPQCTDFGLISAQLIEYDRSYYYLSYYSDLNNDSVWTDYAAWYTNSTVYCISPKVAGVITCPADLYSEGPSSVTTQSDTFFTYCHFTGQGGLMLRVISDSTGAPVKNETITAVLRAANSCDQGYETQVIYVSNFTEETGGWLSPVLPNEGQGFGTFSFSIQYAGETYNFSAMIHPASETCITLKVPSGTVTAPAYYLSSGLCPVQ